MTIQGIAAMTPVQVSQATASSLNATVVGTGSFVTQATLQTQTDTVMVGGVNIKEINAVTPLMGNGTTGTGSQRVTIASDNTAFSVNPLSATTPVSTMNSASANSGLNSAIAAVFDDASPTAITENSFGFIRMSANRNQYMTLRDAAGNERGLNIDANGAIAVTATNATASNLKVAATLDAETTKVIGTVRALGNAGATLDSTVGAGTAPANQVVVGALYNSTEISPSTGQAFALQADSKGRLRGVIMDAAGNTRGANVDASNRLSVSIDNIAAAQTLATVTTVTTVTTLTGTTTLTPGTGATNLGKAVDNAVGSTDTGIAALAKRVTTPATITPANGDYTNLQVDDNGALWVLDLNSSGQTTSLSTLAGAVTSSRMAVNPISGQSGIAAGVGATGATVTRVVVANDAGRTLTSKTGSVASNGNNTIVNAGTNRLKVYAFSLSTTSTTAVTVKFQDGASGTDLWSVILQAPTSVSTGANLVVQPPAWLFATSAATLLNINLSGAFAVQYAVSYFDEA